MGSEVLEIAAAEFKATVREDAGKELVTQAANFTFIVKAGGNGINCCHNTVICQVIRYTKVGRKVGLFHGKGIEDEGEYVIYAVEFADAF